ncbi:MAG: sensor histidine kinase [Minisyncoccota bacterium]
MNFGGQTFKRGATFVRDNPQLLYTIFLFVALPIAFVVTGEQFLSAAQNNQVLEEGARVASLHDALVDTVRDTMDDPALLSARLDRVTARDNELIKLEVLKKINPTTAVVVAVSPATYGTEEGTQISIGSDPTEAGYEYGIVQGQGKPGGTYTFTRTQGTMRVLHGVQAIADDTGDVVGFLVSDTSMARIDITSQKSITHAFLVLLFVVLLLFVLLFRHARIVDYTVLYRKLAEVDKLKDDFISMAAHELRTPLSIIRGYASMLFESKSLAEADHHQAELIDRSAQQLNALVEDLLNVMRIEQGRMDFKFVSLDLSVAAQEVVDMLSISAHEKGLALTLEKTGAVVAQLDVDRIRQILINIVGNAVKYTPAGAVTVKVFSDEATKRAVVRVSDTGIGISAEEQKNLFGKFYRVKSDETKQIRGTGLGLWITKQLVVNMKGTISVESIKGKGMDIEISFPLST